MTDNKRDEIDRAARRDIASLLGRQAVTQSLGLVRTFVVLPLLGPAQLGLYRLILQLSSYSLYLGVGALSTLGVRFPEWDAAGEARKCRVVQRLALNQSIVGTILFIPVFVGLVWGLDLGWDLLLVLALLSGFPLLGDYVTSSFVVRSEFRALARVEIATSALGLVVLLIGALQWGLRGALIGAFTAPLLKVVLGHRFLVPSGERASRAELVEHFRFGFRIWVGSTVIRFAQTADLVLLGLLLPSGSVLLGYYAVGLMVTQSLAQTLTAVTVVQQQNLRRRIGAEGGVTGEAVGSELRRFLGTDSFVGICVASGILVAAWLVIPHMLPAYHAALPGFGALMTSLIFMKVRVYTRTVLQNGGRPNLVIVASVVQLALMAVLYPLLVDERVSTEALGLLRLLVFAAAAAVEVVLAYGLMERRKQATGLLVRLAACSIPALVGFILIPALGDYGPWSLAGTPIAMLGSYAMCNRWMDGAGSEGLLLMRQVLRRLLRR